MKAEVWTRQLFASMLGMEERQLVEWALLLGNDYTDKLWKRVQLQDMPALVGRRDLRAHEVLLVRFC